jgi:WD40 repeat protein
LANIPLTTDSIIDFNVYGSQGGRIAWNVWNYDNDKSTTTIHMVDLATQKETISQPIAGSFDIAVFSADESVLALAGDYDGTIHLLDTNSLTEITTLQGHTDKVVQMAFSSDGAQLYSASNDNSVRVWGIKNE